MWSNASARTPTPPRPPTAPVRTDRSPASTLAATRAMRRSGAAIRLASPITTAIATNSASAPTMRKERRRLDCLLHRGKRVGHAQGSDGADAGSDRRGEHPHAAGFGHRCGGKTARGVQQADGFVCVPLAGFLAREHAPAQSWVSVSPRGELAGMSLVLFALLVLLVGRGAVGAQRCPGPQLRLRLRHRLRLRLRLRLSRCRRRRKHPRPRFRRRRRLRLRPPRRRPESSPADPKSSGPRVSRRIQAGALANSHAWLTDSFEWGRTLTSQWSALRLPTAIGPLGWVQCHRQSSGAKPGWI